MAFNLYFVVTEAPTSRVVECVCLLATMFQQSGEKIEHPEMELLWVEIKPSPLRSRKSQRSLLIGCCYRPPHLAVTFYENLETVLDKAVDMDIILLGDFNAKKSEWFTGETTNYHGSILKEKMDSFDLVQLCSQPTHLDRNGKPEGLLDLIFTNISDGSAPNVDVLPPISTSDHLPVVLNGLKIKSTQPKKSEGHGNRIKWLFERKEKERVSDAFLYENWEQVFQPFNDINETWNRWKLQFFQEIKSFILHRTVTNSLKHRAAPWFTKDLKSLFEWKIVCSRKLAHQERTTIGRLIAPQETKQQEKLRKQN